MHDHRNESLDRAELFLHCKLPQRIAVHNDGNNDRPEYLSQLILKIALYIYLTKIVSVRNVMR
jgi:hypothetical protein